MKTNIETFPFIISALVLIALLFWLITSKHLVEMLKEKGRFSLSKTQLFFWTMIFFISFHIIAIVIGKLPELDQEKMLNLFILMGISFGTTLVGLSIKPPKKPDVMRESHFLLDILSDGSSVQVQRFQNVMFNIIYGSYFLYTAIMECKFMEITNFQLGLMTISSTGFVLLKLQETVKGDAKPSR